MSTCVPESELFLESLSCELSSFVAEALDTAMADSAAVAAAVWALFDFLS